MPLNSGRAAVPSAALGGDTGSVIRRANGLPGCHEHTGLLTTINHKSG